MYFTTSFNEEQNFKPELKQATNYENKGDGWKDYPDPDGAWLNLAAGIQSIGVRMTLQQLCRLHHSIGAYLMDQNPPPDAGTLWPEGEPLSPQQIRGALKPGDYISDYKDEGEVEFPK